MRFHIYFYFQFRKGIKFIEKLQSFPLFCYSIRGFITKWRELANSIIVGPACRKRSRHFSRRVTIIKGLQMDARSQSQELQQSLCNTARLLGRQFYLSSPEKLYAKNVALIYQMLSRSPNNQEAHICTRK